MASLSELQATEDGPKLPARTPDAETPQNSGFQ